MQQGVAEEWKKGSSRRLLLTALVPAECVWIAPGWGEAELVISPHSPVGNSIKVTDVTDLSSHAAAGLGLKAPAAKGAAESTPHRGGQLSVSQDEQVAPRPRSLWRRLFGKT